jgi:hypothetical protein
MVGAYRIRNWREYQHYKGRNPPWVKLHRTLLDDREWRSLSGDAGKLVTDLLLVASEKDRNGEIPANPEWLAWRLRLDSGALAKSLDELVKVNWLMEMNGSASGALAGCEQDATPEKRREEKRRSDGGKCGDCGRPLRKTAGGRWIPCRCRDS